MNHWTSSTSWSSKVASITRANTQKKCPGETVTDAEALIKALNLEVVYPITSQQ